tara:strand:- start:297 stop:749 length:453 start_codon:yes stop_codon:yes gene_type:complete
VELSNRELLKKYSIKYSKQRDSILTVLKNYRKPLTSEQIFDECRREVQNLSLSTVYRILNTFVDEGLALKTNLDRENRALFELERHEHRHHLLCLGCSKIVQISSCPLKQYELEIQDELGYHITSHKLEIYGYCPECRKDLGNDNEKEAH